MNAENKITYESFTERVATRANVSESEADTYIHQLFKTAGDALEQGDEVQLYHFGRFTTTHFEERPGTNPQTGEAITIPEHTRVDFHPYKALLIAVNLPFRHLRTKMLKKEDPDRGTGALMWVLLALALLALILLGIAVNNWLSNRDSTTVVPTEVSTARETGQEAVQSPPVVTAADTEADAAAVTPAEDTADTASEAAAAPTSDAQTGTETAAPGNAAVETTPSSNIVVERGDTFWGISESHWGDTSWWPVLYAENRPDLGHRNPDLIETGISLRIPALEGTVARPTDADLGRKENAYRMVAEDYAELDHPRAAEYRSFVERSYGPF